MSTAVFLAKCSGLKVLLTTLRITSTVQRELRRVGVGLGGIVIALVQRVALDDDRRMLGHFMGRFAKQSESSRMCIEL